jgi:hypothetical protein
MPSGVQISGDDLAILAHTGRWHDAMRSMGRAAVEAELQRRPGRPAELIDDIGGEPPYPTREFCERWCTEQDNVLFQFSLRMAVILTLVVAILACMVMARGDFARLSAGSASGMGGRPAASGDAPRMRVAPDGIYDVPAYRPGNSSQQQLRQQQRQQQQQQMMQFMQNTQPPPPTQ